MAIITIAEFETFYLHRDAMAEQKGSGFIEPRAQPYQPERVHDGADTVLGKRGVQLREGRRGGMGLNREPQIWSPRTPQTGHIFPEPIQGRGIGKGLYK